MAAAAIGLFALGAIFGSFLTVVAHRVPRSYRHYPIFPDGPAVPVFGGGEVGVQGDVTIRGHRQPWRWRNGQPGRGGNLGQRRA